VTVGWSRRAKWNTISQEKLEEKASFLNDLAERVFYVHEKKLHRK
jgi:hypothetical protein